MSEGAAGMQVKRPYPGLFLAFEGVEGSGKSTQTRLLAEDLTRAGYEVTVAREPGTTPLGERIRSIVLEGADLEIPGRSELFLMLAARAAFVDQVVRPALEAGRIVISDRFELSTLAYQGAGRGVPVEEIQRANRLATGGLSPDATILLSLDPEEGVRRQDAVSKRRDRLEREGIEFHRRVARGYEELAERVAGVVRVDAAGSIEEVRMGVRRALSSRFPETFPL
ncbi:MAG TPA: dTMP kinase [Longimicrobiaceae bacterium]